ncbi:MAG: alpha/beta hydrolase family esterase [Marinibacterium sp.]
MTGAGGRLAGLLVAALSGLAGAADAACGTVSMPPCTVDLGEYLVRLPDTPKAAGEPIPAVVFLHGYGGNGKATLRNPRLVPPLLERGYAVIAPQGLRRGANGPQSWSFLPEFAGRDEPTFLQSVVADAATRFGIDPDHVLLSGFSAGGFMVTYLACALPNSFAAYAPVSGGFWRPQPDHCAGPVRLFQTHGWADKTVPLEGRYLGGGAFQQGDIFAGLELWRATNGCLNENPDGTSIRDAFLRRQWTDCSQGSALEFALFPGGHTVPAGWADMVLDWFETLPD